MPKMDATKTIASLGVGAAVGRATADWFMGGIGKLPEHTIFGPLSEASKAELASLLAAGLAYGLTLLHHRLTRRLPALPPTPAAPAPKVIDP